MTVKLTEAAARHVNRYLTRRGKGVGVRLGVKTTGCSGLAYKLEYVDEFAPKMWCLKTTASRCWSTRKAWLTSTAPNSASCAKV